MGRSSLASRTIQHLILLIGAVVWAPIASATLYLEHVATGNQLGVFLKSNADMASVESIDIGWSFDTAVLELLGEPAFEGELAGPDFEFADCDVSARNCGGFFGSPKDPFPASTLLSWLFNVRPGPPPQTIIAVNVSVNEEFPEALTAAIPVPEPGTTLLTLAGLGLLGFWTLRRRVI